MPIPNILQPEIIPIENSLRLRRFDGEYSFAFDWYQDSETVWLVDGKRGPYTMEKLERMYRYLDAYGELYFIEILENNCWKPIGDVTFQRDDLPIVIGEPAYRGKHIGQKVLTALIQRGRVLGYSCLSVNEIYEYNIASRNCFESLGFRASEKTEKGSRFILEL